jgi:hypothetical protein
VCVQSMMNRDHHPPPLPPPAPHSSTTTRPCGCSSYHISNKIKQHKIITKSSCISSSFLLPPCSRVPFFSTRSPCPTLCSTQPLQPTNQPTIRLGIILIQALSALHT